MTSSEDFLPTRKTNILFNQKNAFESAILDLFVGLMFMKKKVLALVIHKNSLSDLLWIVWLIHEAVWQNNLSKQLI